jgi:hypothetical protein
MNDQNKQPDMIELPEAWRRPRTEAEARVVGREVVSRSADAGKYGNGIVVVEKPAGIPIELPGFDTHQAQARSFGGDTRERPTSLSPEEIEEV